MVVKLWEGQRWPLETQMVSLLTYTTLGSDICVP